MDGERLRCAELAMRQVPDEYRTIEAADVAAHERGHSRHRGMHIGWAWGEDERGRVFLDFLSDHPHPGVQAERYFADRTTVPIATPAGMRPVSPDPVEDAELEREFFASNRAAYADLRRRGLLPPEGEGTGSLDVHEHRLGGGWDVVLRDELVKPYWPKLLDFIDGEYSAYDRVYPPQPLVFRAFELTPYDEVKVVILGQDPYPTPGEAHGLAFSVPTHLTSKPASLRNIHKVLESDLSSASGSPVSAPQHGSLEGWAEQGVLLLNTALTVRAGTKADREVHRQWRWEGQGWSTFTDTVIKAVNDKPEGVVFILWGKDARRKKKLIDQQRHAVIESSHPSPLSAWRGFLTSTPFSDANAELTRLGRGEIDWGRCGPVT